MSESFGLIHFVLAWLGSQRDAKANPRVVHRSAIHGVFFYIFSVSSGTNAKKLLLLILSSSNQSSGVGVKRKAGYAFGTSAAYVELGVTDTERLETLI